MSDADAMGAGRRHHAGLAHAARMASPSAIVGSNAPSGPTAYLRCDEGAASGSSEGIRRRNPPTLLRHTIGQRIPGWFVFHDGR